MIYVPGAKTLAPPLSPVYTSGRSATSSVPKTQGTVKGTLEMEYNKPTVQKIIGQLIRIVKHFEIQQRTFFRYYYASTTTDRQ